MSYPSNVFRLEGAALRNSYTAGRDLSAAVVNLEVRVTDQQRQIIELSHSLLLREAENNALRAENNALAARLAAVERLLASLCDSDNG